MNDYLELFANYCFRLYGLYPYQMTETEKAAAKTRFDAIRAEAGLPTTGLYEPQFNVKPVWGTPEGYPD